MAVCLGGERDRDRVVVRCLPTVRWLVNVQAHKMTLRSNQRILRKLTIWLESCGAYA
jgi:hypothetical protein